jgi:ABC-type transport system substrate-binding protein
VLVLLLCLAVACTTPEAPGTGLAEPSRPAPTPTATTSTFRYAIQEPSAIVPPAVVEPDGLAVVDALFDSLTAYDRELRVVPSAAEAWTPETPQRWTFRLRAGATFHDGSPVTAADFKAAWEEAVRRDLVGFLLRDVAGYAELRAGDAGELSGVTAVDDLTLRVELANPRPDLPALVAHPALGPVAAGAWRANPVAYQEAPVGNGPFRIDGAWARGQFVRVARWPAWPNGAPAQVDEVLFRIADPNAAYVAFQQDRFDFAPLPAGALAEATEAFPPTSDDGYQGPGLLLGPTPVLYFLGFRMTRPPFDDLQVRRAVSMAIDRERLAETTLEGNVSPARAIVPPPIPGARPSACGACGHNPAEARRIFADRGITQIDLWINRDGGHEQIAEQVRVDLEAVGVRLVVRSEEPAPDGTFSSYLDTLASGEAGLFRFGWATEYPSMDEALRPLIHTASTPESGGQNYMRYSNPEVDSLLDQARGTLDAPARQLLYQRAEDLALGRDQAIVPLFTFHHRAVAGARVENLYLSPFGLVNLADVALRPPEGP